MWSCGRAVLGRFGPVFRRGSAGGGGGRDYYYRRKASSRAAPAIACHGKSAASASPNAAQRRNFVHLTKISNRSRRRSVARFAVVDRPVVRYSFGGLGAAFAGRAVTRSTAPSSRRSRRRSALGAQWLRRRRRAVARPSLLGRTAFPLVPRSRQSRLRSGAMLPAGKPSGLCRQFSGGEEYLKAGFVEDGDS